MSIIKKPTRREFLATTAAAGTLAAAGPFMPAVHAQA